MNKLPTAEEFSKNSTRLRSALALQDLTDLMIAFTALHVKAALETASIKATIRNIPGVGQMTEVSKNSILEAYPLTNIK